MERNLSEEFDKALRAAAAAAPLPRSWGVDTALPGALPASAFPRARATAEQVLGRLPSAFAQGRRRPPGSNDQIRTIFAGGDPLDEDVLKIMRHGQSEANTASFDNEPVPLVISVETGQAVTTLPVLKFKNRKHAFFAIN